ncbi:LAFA_0E02960g1_1 [Lachancea sp. 'fantastica']|nr:LAFA_0E02960g1_1 [Lachancea sp. 'fantastica']
MRKTKLWRSAFLGSFTIILSIYILALAARDSSLGTRQESFITAVKKVTGSNVIRLANSIQLRDFFRAWQLDECDALRAGPLNDDLTWKEVSATRAIVRGPSRNSKNFDLYKFDPRFTIATYYRYLRDSPDVQKVPFNWYDWKDLGSKLNKLTYPNGPLCDDIYTEIGLEQPDGNRKGLPEISIEKGSKSNFCTPNLNSPVQFRVRRLQDRCEAEALALQAASFLFHDGLRPANLIFLNGNGRSKIVGTTFTDNNQSLINSTLVESFLKDGSVAGRDPDEPFTEKSPSVIFDPTAEYSKLFRSNETAIKKPLSYLSAVGPDRFEFRLQEELNALRVKSILTISEQNFVNNLMYVQEHLKVGAPEFKYFHEASDITSDGNKYQTFMDSRFFSGLIGDHWQRQRIFNALTRAWLHFVESENLASWLAHESLHGYLFTGSRFPWSPSTSFQMPLHDLGLLAKNFNQSLVIAPANEGNGRYFVDVQPFIASRNSADGVNNVDARFIDIDSGFYIDIFGLGYSSHPLDALRFQNKYGTDHGDRPNTEDFKREHGILSERNGRGLLLAEISPLRLSRYHGLPVRVPLSTLTVLKDEYHVSSSFYGAKVQINKHRLVPSLGVWVANSKLDSWLGPRRASKAHELTIKDVQSMLIVVTSQESHQDLVQWIRSQEQFTFRLEELSLESSKLKRDEKMAALESLQSAQFELASSFSDPFVGEMRVKRFTELVSLMDHAVGTSMFSKRVLSDIMCELSDTFISRKRKQREQHVEIGRAAPDDTANTQSTRLFYMREDARERPAREPLIFKVDFTV